MRNGYTGSDKMYQAASGAIEKSRGAAHGGAASTSNINHNGENVKREQDGRDWVDNPPKTAKRDITSGIICLNDVQTKDIEWLWEPYIPLGKITLLRGNPGQGKTYFSMELASIVSNGSSFPGESAFAGSEAGNVLLLSAEDDLSDTVKPRLIKTNADLSKIQTVGNDFIDSLTFASNDFERLLDAVKPRLVIVDPIQAFLGSKIDSHKTNEVRPIMSKLRTMAEKYTSSIVLIEHLNKNVGGNSIYRGVGSIDFTAAARSILMLGSNPDDESDKGIAHIKSNCGKKGGVVGFTISESGLEWNPHTTLTADMVQGYVKAKNNRVDNALDEAIEFLQDVLAGGKQSSKDIFVEAKLRSISESTLKRARQKMGIDCKEREGFGSNTVVYWKLPNENESLDHVN